MTDIATVITSLKTAVDIAKLIKDSHQKLEQAEIKLKLADLISALADAKIEIADIQELLLEKDKEIKELKEADDLSKKVIWRKPYYFVVEPDEEETGPYCQNCYDGDRKLIRLQEGCTGYWTCHSCDKSVSDNSYDTGSDFAVGSTSRSSIDWDGY